MPPKVFLLLVLPFLPFLETKTTSTKVIISGQVKLEGCHEVKACGSKLGKRDVFTNYLKDSHWVSMKGQVILKGCYLVRTCKPLPGSKKNPRISCKAIKKHRKYAKSGVYYIKTEQRTTKVYCYMEDIIGCGGGGWTTIMKTDGKKKTFAYNSKFWKNKKTYHVTNGQSGVDNKETKLPTYWTLPFNSLCLGMKTSSQKQSNWIRLNYKASSLYSVIADGKYRSFSLDRSTWKSLIAGSSLQRNCNRGGFNAVSDKIYIYAMVRIGMISNEQNDCATPDSYVGFGGNEKRCAFTGNCAGCCSSDNGEKKNPANGYILAQ